MATQSLMQIYDTVAKAYRSFTTTDLASIGGGGGGAVTQSTGATATPWYMQGVNGGAAERLATEAKQPAFGPAGTPSADVASVQGVASGTPIPTSNAVATQADGHSATIGATADADTAPTLVGLLKAAKATLALLNAKLPTAAALSDTTANPTTAMVGSGLMLWNSGGNSWRRAAGLSSAPQVLAVGNSGFFPLEIAGKTGSGVWTPLLVDTPGRALVSGAAASGSAVAGSPVLVGGQDEQGLTRTALLDYRGAMVSAAANLGGDLMVSSRVAICRGVSVEGQNFNLFAERESGSATVDYNATTGRYDLATTVASLDSAILVHNNIVHYVENNPMGCAITAALSSTTTTNKRIEFGMMAAAATTGTNFLTADRFGFYIEAGVLGVFAYSTITNAYLFQVAQSSWTDPLNGSGASKRTFTYATALLNQFKLEANQVWLGSDDMEFLVNDVLVYKRDFKFGNPTANPISRVPHMRPYVAHHNTGVAAASTVSVNCLEGVRMTQQLPSGRQFTSARNSARTSLASATELPVYALRVASTVKARQFLLERFTARSASQAVRVRAYLGRASDFLITGGTWETPAANRGTVLEENKATGSEMAWTPTTANLNKIVDDVILSSADITKEYDTETFFEEGFPLKGDAWLGIDGDGEQRLIVWTATSEGGADGQLNILNVHGREIG